MALRPPTKLDHKKRYLQIALNSTLAEAQSIISSIPISDRIILEAGTPLIKRYGADAISKIRSWYMYRLAGSTHRTGNNAIREIPGGALGTFFSFLDWGISTKPGVRQKTPSSSSGASEPYIVADMKMMDRGETEVRIAAQAGASAVVALGASPVESLNAFIKACEKCHVDAMIDMMNVEYPLAVLRKLKKLPSVVILHRGVDEEQFNKEKQLPLYEIQRIKSNYDILIAVAGGDSLREAERAIFNDADIVVVWKSFYQKTRDTQQLAEVFLKEIR